MNSTKNLRLVHENPSLNEISEHLECNVILNQNEMRNTYYVYYVLKYVIYFLQIVCCWLLVFEFGIFCFFKYSILASPHIGRRRRATRGSKRASRAALATAPAYRGSALRSTAREFWRFNVDLQNLKRKHTGFHLLNRILTILEKMMLKITYLVQTNLTFYTLTVNQ